MKNKSIVGIALVLILLFSAFTVQAFARANAHIDEASILLNSSMSATFSCSTRAKYNISVGSVQLEVKNSNGTWSFVKNLSAPPSASNVSNYTKVMNYSSSCTSGKTYRIKAVFYAGTESVSRISAEKKYN